MSIGGRSSKLIQQAELVQQMGKGKGKEFHAPIEVLPPELLDCVVDYLPVRDLKNLALANKMFSSFAVPAIYRSPTTQLLITCATMGRKPRHGDFRRTDFPKERSFADVVAALPTDEKAYGIKRLHIENAYAPCIEFENWRLAHQLLQRLPGLVEMDMTWLVEHLRWVPRLTSAFNGPPPKFEDPEGQTEVDRVSRLIEEFGNTTLKQLQYVFFDFGVADTPRRLLEKMSSLKVLRVRGHGEQQWENCLELMNAIRDTVGPQLEELGIWNPPPGPQGGKAAIDVLANRAAFPRLKVFRLGVQTFGYFDDILEDEERILLLWNIYQAAKAHGGWKFLYPGWELELCGLSGLTETDVAELLEWLKTSFTGYDGFVSQKECSFIEHPEESLPLIQETITIFETLQGTTPFRLHLKSVYPPTAATATNGNQLLGLFVRAAPIIDKLILEIDDLNDLLGTNDERRTMKQAKKIVAKWDVFLSAFLPELRNCTSIAYSAHSDKFGCVISLKKYADFFSELCVNAKLTSLDIDCSGILQPDTSGKLQLRENPPGQLRKVIIELDSLLPRLSKLKELTLRHLFILRPCEMEWLKALPGRMPGLKSLKICGLHWHANFEHELEKLARKHLRIPGFFHLGGLLEEDTDGEWEDEDDSDENSGNSDDDDEDDPMQAAVLSMMMATQLYPGDGPPGLEPFFVPPFPHPNPHIHPPPPAASDSDSDEPPPLESAINSSDEEDEMPMPVEIMNAAVPKREINKPEVSKSEASQSKVSKPEAGETKASEPISTDKPNGNEAADDSMPPLVPFLDGEKDGDEDNESIASTGSEFGMDPRFKADVDLELRSTRFAGWLSGLLRDASDGRLDIVLIDDVAFDATQSFPWTRRDEIWQERWKKKTRYGWEGDLD